MSLATEFAVSVPIPARYPSAPDAHPSTRMHAVPELVPGAPEPIAAPDRLARVVVLRPPSDSASRALRLTRRGVIVVALAVALACAALVWLAALSAPADNSAPTHAGPAVVTVQSGDTLWSIAGRVAPNRDPRAVVDSLRQLNHLDGVALEPGQHLRVR